MKAAMVVVWIVYKLCCMVSGSFLTVSSGTCTVVYIYVYSVPVGVQCVEGVIERVREREIGQ